MSEMKGKDFLTIIYQVDNVVGPEKNDTIDEDRVDGYKQISNDEVQDGENNVGNSLDDEDPSDYTGALDFIKNEKTLTPRAIITGILIGILVAIMNVNFGLKTGWTQGKKRKKLKKLKRRLYLCSTCLHWSF
jgi:hypothetical protein